uniref:Uncharacterized protein n=1 Tax=Hucho hucho TaxID=62062 RepID=A0A4W5NLL3_9TELE
MQTREPNQVWNPEPLKALEIWLQETDVKLTQINGQRKYGGSPDGELAYTGGVEGVSLRVGPGVEGVSLRVGPGVEVLSVVVVYASHHAWQSTPPISPAFCWAVGGPSPMVHAAPVSPRGVSKVPPVDTAALLQGVCEVYGRGKLNDLQYCHMGPDRFLCFSYWVYVSGLATPFTGMVQTLLGPNPGAIQEARRATAQQVLSALYRA